MIRGFLKPAFAISLFTAVAAALTFGAPPAVAGHIKKGDNAAPKTQLLFPVINPERGRNIFIKKGCVICHSINGAGGTIGPPLDAPANKRVINPFSFAANMWNHAPGMIAAQKKKLGGQLHFTGEELGNIIAFIQDDAVQSDFGKLAIRKYSDKNAPKIRLAMPIMSPERGKKVFVNKGCVTCHSFNGVGGEDAPAMDIHTKEKLVNPFSFAAKMWDHAPGMIAAQEDELGGQLHFTGTQLADLTAFIHDADARRNFSKKDLTPRIRKMMSKMEAGDEDSGSDKKK
jgi:cytochrome c551/c552